MAEKRTDIEIEELREAGEDGGDLMGYFARGHHDPYAFAEAANRYSGALTFDDRRHVNPKYVSHGWWRTCQMADEPKGTYEFRAAPPGERGAWKVTICESVSNYSRKQWRMRMREYERGLTDGIHKALLFLLGEIEYGSVIEGLEDIKRRRAIADHLRASFSRAETQIKEDNAA